jgi:hypothetical protein
MTRITWPVPNVWRRLSLSEPPKEVQYDDIGSSPRIQQVTDDTDIPAFLRKQNN